MIRTSVVGSQPEFELGILRTGKDTFTCSSPALSEEDVLAELATQRKFNIQSQLKTRIDILSEGEISRVDRAAPGHAYVTYIGRFMSGLRKPSHQFKSDAPPLVIRSQLKDPDPELVVISGQLKDLDPEIICDDWKQAQILTDKPVKINLPGPLTFACRFDNLHHRKLAECSYEYAQLLNDQMLALAEAGCRWIQLDDPSLITSTAGLEFGIDHLNASLAGLPNEMETIVHLCRGNQYQLGGRDRFVPPYPYYIPLAEKLRHSPIKGISIESPHEYADDFLLDQFGEKTILLGIVDVNGDFPSETEMIKIIQTALNNLPSDQLIVTPNCGIKHLSHEMAEKMLKSMVSAVKQVNLSL